MKKAFLNIILGISLCHWTVAQTPYATLDDIKVKIDSAEYFERELRAETALRYFKSVESPLQQLLINKPQSSELWLMDGMVKARTQSLDDAYSSFKTSLLLDPENLESKIEYISFTVKSAQNIANTGELNKSQEWLQDAFNVCAAALAISPFHSRLHELAGDIYALANDIKNCTYHYEMSYKAEKKPEIAIKLYRLYAVNQDYKNEIKMAGILNRTYATYAEFYAVQAQLGFKSILADPMENSRYLPGVKGTLMKAVELGSQNPLTYQDYIEMIKMGYSIDESYRVAKSEILMVLTKASEIFVEMPEAKAEILLQGADLLKDLDHDAEACSIYKEAISLRPSNGNSMLQTYCK